MKPCGCMRYFAVYPCGHELEIWEYCGIAKAKNLLKRGPPTVCASYADRKVSPDLEDTCGSTCLTKPFLCRICGADKQVSWRCSRCHVLRNPETLIWDICSCPGHRCTELALGKSGAAVCNHCEAGLCSIRLPNEKFRPNYTAGTDTGPPVPVLSWKCHLCSGNNRTPANAMACTRSGGCRHQRCGQCKPLFDCNCKCGCSNCFVEGGPMVCDWCVKTCQSVLER
ncbi:hypothetical protein Hte_008564 [Hypoxylon texense]